MKTFKNKFIVLMTLLLVFSCDNGIDPITEVDPGADATAPQVKIISPTEGTTIKVFEEVTSLNIKIEVTDDIEVESISILLNESEIINFSNFKDYRRALEEYTYNNLTDGDHTLQSSPQILKVKRLLQKLISASNLLTVHYLMVRYYTWPLMVTIEI